jgi:hypothetical protein
VIHGNVLSLALGQQLRRWLRQETTNAMQESCKHRVERGELKRRIVYLGFRE